MTNQKIITLTGLVLVILIVILGALFTKLIFFSHYISEITLVDDFEITSEWKEIGNPNLLTMEKENQYLALVLKPPFTDDTPGGGIKTPEGSIINPEIRLIDVDGKEYKLRFGGSRRFEDKDFVHYRYDEGLPAGKKYSKILIRSSSNIPVKQILWSGYDSKDLP